MNNKIAVSICCVAYNHESFIRNCLDGFLNQITDFKYEILIHDDASTDNTQSIIRTYQDKYPDKIYAIYQTDNQWLKNGRNPLLKILFPMVRGKYIALCEGDDYWCDENKLQKQVDFLEQNPDYSICWTKATYSDALNNNQYVPESFEQPLNGKTHYTIDLNFYYDKYATPTLTAVFIASKLARFNLKKFSYFNDSVLFFILLSQGKGALLNFNSSVYRIHASGLWSGASDYTKKVNFFYALDSAITMIPQLASITHLVTWRNANLIQAYYLMSENFSGKNFKTFIFLFYKILKYQNRVEQKKAIKTFLKTLVFKR